MQVICEPRSAGKTTKAIEWCKEDNNRILIVQNQEMKKFAKERGLPDEQVKTWEEIRRKGVYMMHEKELIIDDVERYIEDTFRHAGIFPKIGGFTCTPTDEKGNPVYRIEDLPF